ncbi:MAG TPA: hypothetical protein VMI52_14610 [Acetobacteraceae bacterium]|nr:hypothetical protein [Acetobacteraceae bacterium]
MKITAIVSSYLALLRVEFDLATGHGATTPIDTGRGVYFGLTRDGDRLLVAARNRLPGGRARGGETDVIHTLDLAGGVLRPWLRDPELDDLHQIRRIGDRLGVVLGHGSKVTMFDLRSGARRGEIALLPLVPEPLRCPVSPAHPTDPHHFNSLGVDGESLLVLAHNWERGSFALELDHAAAPARLVAVHQGLGRASHDVARIDGTLHVLDSEGGRLLLRGASERAVTLPRLSSPGFARGLAITARHVLITYGFWSAERFGRVRTPTRLCVLDRATWAIVADMELGLFGNPTAIRVVSEPDLADGDG